MRLAIGFEIPKDAGPLILIVGQCASETLVASHCSGSFVKTGVAQDRRPTEVGVVQSQDGSITMSVDGRGWCVPVSVLCTVPNSSTDKGVMVSLHLGSPPEAVGEASLLDLVTF